MGVYGVVGGQVRSVIGISNIEYGGGGIVVYEQNVDVIDSLYWERPYVVDVMVGGVVLELVRSFVFSQDAVIGVDVGDLPVTYRGVVKGIDGSRAAMSIYDGGVSGFYSVGGDTYFFSKDGGLYNGLRDGGYGDFGCRVMEVGDVVGGLDGDDIGGVVGALPCIGIRLEVDKDVYDKFVTDVNLIGFISGVWNVVFYLYEDIGIDMYLHEVVVYRDYERYGCDDSYECLKMVGDAIGGGVRGDLTQLWKLSTSASGGIAWLPGVCSGSMGFRSSYAGINATYAVFPKYSWTVMVAAHEVGHNLGSHHTHACRWNGNNTAIDGCYGVEGECENPGVPVGGGTIMSYCHLRDVGINFALGFGEQPAKVMRDRVGRVMCLDDVCSIDGDCIDVDLEVKFDFYPMEVSWAIIDSENRLVEQGVGFDKSYAGGVYGKRLCLVRGCYRLELVDMGGDGLVSDVDGCFIGGFFRVINNGTTIFYANEWGKSGVFDLWVERVVADRCSYIDFSGRDVIEYCSRDNGVGVIGGGMVSVYRNGWKAVQFDYSVTRSTVIEFEFKSDGVEGDIHAIGFDTKVGGLGRSNRAVQVYGRRMWGYQGVNNYGGGGWKRYRVNIGEWYYGYNKSYLGKVNYMFFIASDGGRVGANSVFRNIRVYEDGMCVGDGVVMDAGVDVGSIRYDGGVVYPNPTDGIFRIGSGGIGGAFIVYNLMGGVVYSGVNVGDDIDVSFLSSGVYYVVGAFGVSKLVIQRM